MSQPENSSVQISEFMDTGMQRNGMDGHPSECVLPVDFGGGCEKVVVFFQPNTKVEMTNNLPTNFKREIDARIKMVEILIHACPDA